MVKAPDAGDQGVIAQWTCSETPSSGQVHSSRFLSVYLSGEQTSVVTAFCFKEEKKKKELQASVLLRECPRTFDPFLPGKNKYIHTWAPVCNFGGRNTANYEILVLARN